MVRVEQSSSTTIEKGRARLSAILSAVGALAALLAGVAVVGAAALPAAAAPQALLEAGRAAIADAAASGTASPGVSSSESYSLLSSTGRLTGFGAALSGQVSSSGSPVVGVAPTPDDHGAWVAEADGTVQALGDAVDHGSLASPPPAPIVGIAADPVTGGYWLAASNGAIFAFDAPFLGSTGGAALRRPIVGISATPDGQGYRLVASDGGVFDFGDARFYGSTGGIILDRPVVGMASTADGKGYWLVASDGGIFAYGDARFLGSTGRVRLWSPVIGMAANAAGTGYWLVASDGGVFSFGQAPFYGSVSGTGQRIVGMAVGDGGYQNPLRAIRNLRAERVDQGVDYGGSGPIYAMGDGVVTNTFNSGWPGGAFISYRLVDGPAQGKYVYVAENVVPRVKVGQTVNSNTVIGTLVDAYPDMETGWANPPGLGDAAAGTAGQWTTITESKSLPTAYGANFSRLLAELGAPAGLSNGAPIGALPPGWPTW